MYAVCLSAVAPSDKTPHHEMECYLVMHAQALHLLNTEYAQAVRVLQALRSEHQNAQGVHYPVGEQPCKLVQEFVVSNESHAQLQHV